MIDLVHGLRLRNRAIFFGVQGLFKDRLETYHHITKMNICVLYV